MRILDFQYEMKLTFSNEIKDQFFQLRCLPLDNEVQHVVDHKIKIFPMGIYSTTKDGFGNTVLSGSTLEPHKQFSFNVSGKVEVDSDKFCTDRCHPLYRYETELTKYTDDMDFVLIDDTFENIIKDLSAQVYYALEYKPGCTTFSTTAYEAYKLKKGVCQDYAHITLAVLHHYHIPCRYVAGMMLGEGATHAWIEAYDGQRWYAYDPTNNKKVDDTYIALAKGRDWKDCCIDKGIFDGKDTKQKLKVKVKVK
ncbi:MAG: transglutaminase family protein [Erysipelotrichaceae bacterium]|nr:transglutaminase family protein [Erysipelotrichaceae bacterium]